MGNYSEKVKGYVITLEYDTYFFINDFYRYQTSEIIEQLKILTIDLHRYGFFLLHSDDSIYVDERYLLDDKTGFYIRSENPVSGNYTGNESFFDYFYYKFHKTLKQNHITPQIHLQNIRTEKA